MFLKHYDITLNRLQEEDLELLRHWRNSPLIQQTMEFREFITPGMQVEWFRSINNIYNMYLIISHREKEIGLLNAKNIDWDKKSFETGIFFWDADYYNSFVPAIVSLISTNFSFKIMNCETLYARTLKTNKHAIKYNLTLGYELCEGQEEVENQLYKLTWAKFRKVAKKLRRVLEIYGSDKQEGRIVVEPHDYEQGYGKFFDNKLTDSGLVWIQTEKGKEFILHSLV
jgi:RimJ/RimL family protein N-acetyltransferase